MSSVIVKSLRTKEGRTDRMVRSWKICFGIGFLEMSVDVWMHDVGRLCASGLILIVLGFLGICGESAAFIVSQCRDGAT